MINRSFGEVVVVACKYSTYLYVGLHQNGNRR